MRHHRKKKLFGRVKKVRTALFDSVARSVLLRGGVATTLAKAKALRPHIERLITIAKTDTLSQRRLLASRVRNDNTLIKKMFTEIGPKYKNRAGGYTRIVKLGKVGARSAESARIELV